MVSPCHFWTVPCKWRWTHWCWWNCPWAREHWRMQESKISSAYSSLSKAAKHASILHFFCGTPRFDKITMEMGFINDDIEPYLAPGVGANRPLMVMPRLRWTLEWQFIWITAVFGWRWGLVATSTGLPGSPLPRSSHPTSTKSPFSDLDTPKKLLLTAQSKGNRHKCLFSWRVKNLITRLKHFKQSQVFCLQIFQ